MADNYLERKRRDYEKRKAEWLQKKGYHSRLSSKAGKRGFIRKTHCSTLLAK